MQGKKELFHTFVAKGLFLCKRARPDIKPTIALLATQVQAPNEQDWCKLVKLMLYLKHTSKEALALTFNKMHKIKWYVDAAFALHFDKRAILGQLCC
jgi:hypothetical protein